MRIGWRVITALDFGVLRARGPDAISFLQGQLSNDATRVQRGQWQLSGYHTPQGRAIALLRLTLLAPDDVLAVLPLELVAVVVTRLKRFVLRAKVQITDDSAHWQVLGFHGERARLASRSRMRLPMAARVIWCWCPDHSTWMPHRSAAPGMTGWHATSKRVCHRCIWQPAKRS